MRFEDPENEEKFTENDMLQWVHQRLNLLPIEAKNGLRYMHITEKAR